ncbi:hypothetical protein MTO96_046910, partial [Rhipicephalus appendiculatus]
IKVPYPKSFCHIKRKILPYVRCNETFVEDWQAALFNESVILCTSSTGKDVCQGDSGGPVTMWRHGLGYQVGVVSFGIGCARPHGTSLHTKPTFLPAVDCLRDGSPQGSGHRRLLIRPHVRPRTLAHKAEMESHSYQ